MYATPNLDEYTNRELPKGRPCRGGVMLRSSRFPAERCWAPVRSIDTRQQPRRAAAAGPGPRLALVAPMPQWRQDYPNNRPPNSGDRYLGCGPKLPPVLQKKIMGLAPMAAIVDKGMTEEEAQAAKPFADLDAKWAGNQRDTVNFIRMAYNSFKRS
jgi:hypothetical protein